MWVPEFTMFKDFESINIDNIFGNELNKYEKNAND
jgi:hypothetical protein